MLGELPDQFVDYMVMKDNEPQKIYHPTGKKKDDDGQLVVSDREDEEVKEAIGESSNIEKLGHLEKI